MKTSTAFLCAVISGILLCCAYPPFWLGFLAFTAFVPMFYIVDFYKPLRVFLWAWFSGTVFLGISMCWLCRHPDVPWLIIIPVVIIQAFFYALPFVCMGYIRRISPWAGLAVFPFAVAGIEWIRSFDQLAFPWMILGNSQTAYPWLIQFADITSAYGVSWWIAMVNVSVYLLIRKRSVKRGAILAVLFVVPLVYSQIVINKSPDSGQEITVALIQGNVFPEEKWADGQEEWNINLYRSMSIESMAYNPDIIVWPETATPVYLVEIGSYRRMVQSLVDSIGVPIFTGFPAINFDTGDTWNSSGLFLPGKNEVERYHKIHLVPFGEAIPLDNYFPSLKNLHLGQANWSRGTEIVLFEPPGIPPFNAAICFESIFPDLIRKFILKGSQFIVVITNDVWFGAFASPIQHAMISAMRAIEFHRPVVRCANTGVSMIIDSCGKVKKMTETNERTILVETISPADTETIYLRFGNIFSLASFLITLISLIVCFIKRKKISERLYV